MKISIAFTLLILAFGLAIGWQDHRRLLSVTEIHSQLVTEATALGIVTDLSNLAAAPRITKHERENREISTKDTAAALIAFAKEMEAMEKSGKHQSDDAMAFQKRILELMDKMAALDSEGIKILIAQIRATTDLKEDTRKGIIGFSIMTLATDHPQAALALFTESGDLLKDNGMMGKQVISSALARWAQDDPQSALEWVRKNSELHPDLVTDDAKQGIIKGAAINDPKLAFKLIDELKSPDENDSAVREIVRAAKTDEDRTATLAALRDHLGTISDKAKAEKFQSNTIKSLASNVAETGYDSAQKWLATAKLSPEELAAFAQGVGQSGKNADTGNWVQWIGANLPASDIKSTITSMVWGWTRNDYAAAGKWLSSTPDGPAKNISVKAYAESVSSYEPDVAAQWAMTLPAGKDRDQTLENIHSNWPKTDAAGAAAFATEHGIK
ncbi:MAG: hypothetical protein ABI600_18610 [Luteolibacter sp.]